MLDGVHCSAARQMRCRRDSYSECRKICTLGYWDFASVCMKGMGAVIYSEVGATSLSNLQYIGYGGALVRASSVVN